MTGDPQKFDQTVVALTSEGKTSRLLRSGDIIGDTYRLKKLIGQGGMGYVFRAEHLIIGKEYALKMLAPDQINEVTWSRFQSEGKAIARLDHPNIVKIYNMGVDRGDCPYYVMDLLDGVALSDCIADKMPLSLDEILEMFIQLASGFGYAHSRGIIHRDVKPSNVVLVDSGGQYPTAKIVDFGIAKLVGANDLHQQSLTATGEIFGSPYYMSPEQCLGTAIDHRADIYSLGCTLFEALCGHPPFEGESALQTVMMHQSRPTPTLESASDKYWGEEIEALVAKMLMKRPAERYQSMDQVLHDLERIRGHKAVGKNVETGFISSVDSRLEDLGSGYEEEQQNKIKRRRTLTLWFAVSLCFALAVGGVIFAYSRRPTARTGRTLETAAPTRKDWDRYEPEKARKIAALKTEVEGFPEITSTLDKAKGIRTFHCPPLSAGQLCWGSATKPGANFDSFGDAVGSAKAIKEPVVPANRPIWIRVVWGKESFECPEFLAKFGPGELEGIELHSTISLVDADDEAFRKQVNAQTAAVINATSKWTNLQFVEIYNLPATNECLTELDKHRTLRRFIVHQSDANPEFLGRRQFLHQLTSTELFDLSDSSAVMSGLKGSRAIESIQLHDTHVSASALADLASCPNLAHFGTDSCPLDSRAIEALSTIKSLKELIIVQAGLDRSQIADLSKLAFIPKLVFDISDWSDLDRAKLAKALPKANLSWRKQKPTPEDADK